MSPLGRYRERWRQRWNRFMLWELNHAPHVLLFFALILGLCMWQGGKLSRRLRGGLVNLPGSESEEVRQVVEGYFSKAIAYPIILVQEETGSSSELEKSWSLALEKVKRIPKVRDVIDMHLGRKIVATVTLPTHSFEEAQQMINLLHKVELPPELGDPEVVVEPDGRVWIRVETNVRSFKEGETRREKLDQLLSSIHLPVQPVAKIEVTRHPRRNFAMVQAMVYSYQEAESLTASLQKGLADLNLPEGTHVRVTGLPPLFYDLNRQAVSTLKKAEWIGLPICFLMLIWVFESPVAAALPILVALATLSMGSAVMSKVGKYIDISMFVPSVLAMIGLGIGVDYMLILLARFRESMEKHHHRANEAILEAMHRVAPVLWSSAFTVAVGFSALVFTPVMMFRAMGIAGIVVICCALICIFTVSPPLFKACHGWFLWRKLDNAERKGLVLKRWTRLIIHHPKICLTAGLFLMLLIASQLRDLQMVSLNPETLPEDLESRKGYNLCKNSFGAGWLMPALIYVETPATLDHEAYLSLEKAFINQLRALGNTFDAVGASDLSAAQDQGFSIEIPGNFFTSQDGKRHLLLATFDGNPLSLEGRHWVETLRRMGKQTWKKSNGFTCQVGGVVAGTIDMDRAIRIYLTRTILFCLSTTLICLAWVYRSLLIPIQAVAMNLLSVSAAYGFVVLWFQKNVGSLFGADLMGSFGINSVVVLLLFCALFGLSMDYQVFLISRMAEEWRVSHNNQLAVRHGIELTGKVVTGAAAIMITIFLSFAFVSVLETRQFGTGMAAAIALDATIIRLLIFPSSMLLMGSWNWWWPWGGKQTHAHHHSHSATTHGHHG